MLGSEDRTQARIRVKRERSSPGMPHDAILSDLQYTPYAGLRAGTSSRWRVVWRYSLRRVWARRFTRVMLLLAWIPSAVLTGMLAFLYLGALQSDAQLLQNVPLLRWFASLLDWQQWLVLVPLSQAVASTAIERDRHYGVLLFSVARSLTVKHYLLGRALGIGTWMLLLGGLPIVLPWAIAMQMNSSTDPILMLSIPGRALLYVTMVSASLVALAMAVSSYAKQRSSTLWLWSLLLFGPMMLARALTSFADMPAWLQHCSLPGLWQLIQEGLFPSAAATISSTEIILAWGVIALISVFSLGWAHRCLQHPNALA